MTIQRWKTFISFINEGVFLVGMGDEAIIKFNYNLNEPLIKPDGKKISNYVSESEHKKECENSHVMLSKNYMLKIMLHRPYEPNITIETINAEYITKDFNVEINTLSKKNNAVIQSIEMTNYAVPLDFNAPLFVWIEYHDNVKRFFCVANVITYNKESEYRYELNKQFGHISHCKLLNEKYVFIVRKLNVCEIRKMDKTFTVIESFVHFGDEVYAVDVGYNCLCINTETNENCEENKEDTNVNVVVKHQHESVNNNNVQLYQHTNMHREKIILDNEDDLYKKVQCNSNNIALTTNVLNTRNIKVNDHNEIKTTHIVVSSGQKNNNNTTTQRLQKHM